MARHHCPEMEAPAMPGARMRPALTGFGLFMIAIVVQYAPVPRAAVPDRMNIHIEAPAKLTFWVWRELNSVTQFIPQVAVGCSSVWLELDLRSERIAKLAPRIKKAPVAAAPLMKMGIFTPRKMVLPWLGTGVSQFPPSR